MKKLKAVLTDLNWPVVGFCMVALTIVGGLHAAILYALGYVEPMNVVLGYPIATILLVIYEVVAHMQPPKNRYE